MTCTDCGCTEDNACEGGCFWITREPPVCSRCWLQRYVKVAFGNGTPFIAQAEQEVGELEYIFQQWAMETDHGTHNPPRAGVAVDLMPRLWRPGDPIV